MRYDFFLAHVSNEAEDQVYYWRQHKRLKIRTAVRRLVD